MHLEVLGVVIGIVMLVIGARLFRRHTPGFSTRYETFLPYFIFSFLGALPVFVLSLVHNGHGEVVTYNVMGASFSALILSGFILATGKDWVASRSNAYLDLFLVFFGTCALDFIGYMVGLGFNEAMWLQCGLVLLVLAMRYFRDRDDPYFRRQLERRPADTVAKDNIPMAAFALVLYLAGTYMFMDGVALQVDYFVHLEQMVAMFFMAVIISVSQIIFANVVRRRGSPNMSVVFCMGCIFWNTVLLLISTVALDASYFV